jgi:excisionase family DNA binding protein
MLSQTIRAQESKQAFVVDPLMRLSEAAPMIGNPSYATLLKWIKKGALRVHRVGKLGHMRVRLSEVERFRAAGEVHDAG